MARRLPPTTFSLLACLVVAGVTATANTSTSTNRTVYSVDMDDYSADDVSVPQDTAQPAVNNGSSVAEGGQQVLSDRVTLFNLVKPQVISVDKYVSVLIYCVGFPGNILSFAVWIRKRMRHSSGCYLAALAVDDFIFLSLHVVFELHMVWGWQPLNTPVLCQLFPIVFLSSQYLGPLLVLGFTTERYISICHPFQREQFCTVRRARTIIAVLVSLALGLSAVQGYFYTMQQTPPVNGTYECGPRYVVSQGGNTSLLILWNLSIEILTFLLVPLTVLLLNILVICELRRLSRTEQVTLHGHSQRTSATTVMLLAVSFYLIFTTLPVTIAYTLFYEFEYDWNRSTSFEGTLNDPLFQRWVTYELVLAAVREFGTTQYAFNVIFYLVTGRVFRNELRKLLVQAACGGRLGLSISKRYSSLKGSLRRDGSRTASTWVSANGHTPSGPDKPVDASETNV